MKKTLLASLTKAINAYLDLDSESKQRLKKLKGHVITIELLPFHFIFQCLFSERGIDIQADEMLVADAKIHGTPLQMLGVMINKDNRQRFFADDLIIEGNAEFGQQVVELFDELHIDWEEYLSRLIGDIPAYHTGRFIRDISTWLKNTEKSFATDVNEYVHEEAKWLPTREALHDFFAEIDTLRMDNDRLEAKVKQLQAIIMEPEVKQ